MRQNTCPDCGSQRFYFRDQDDRYTLYEFDLQDGQIVYLDQGVRTNPPPVGDDTETFCDRCAWHDRFSTLKR